MQILSSIWYIEGSGLEIEAVASQLVDWRLSSEELDLLFEY
jgi:hypothetical protein